nr:MAG TPA: hypothetical protein [Caudoviricetes sp.]
MNAVRWTVSRAILKHGAIISRAAQHCESLRPIPTVTVGSTDQQHRKTKTMGILNDIDSAA